MRRAPSVDHSTVAAPGAVVEPAPDDETTTALPEVASEHAPVGWGERRASRARGRGALLFPSRSRSCWSCSSRRWRRRRRRRSPRSPTRSTSSRPRSAAASPTWPSARSTRSSSTCSRRSPSSSPSSSSGGWSRSRTSPTAPTSPGCRPTVTAMAGGLLAAVATLSIARYWLIGHAGDGFAALEGLARTVAAAFALAMWPWAFGQAVHLTNLFTSSLLASDSVVKPSATMLAAATRAAISRAHQSARAVSRPRHRRSPRCCCSSGCRC